MLKIKHGKYLGKAELFKGPFGFLFRWLGGTPVDRFSKHGVVDQVVDKFNNNEKLFSVSATLNDLELVFNSFLNLSIKKFYEIF